MEISGLLIITVFVIGVYIKAPDTLGLPKDNPKVKTVRRMQIAFLVVIIGRSLLPALGMDKLFSPEINDKIAVGINAIIIMYFGNLLPKVPIYRKMEKKNPWTTGDEKVWRKATKIFAYLSFLIAISMFILSFYFDSNTVVTVCQFIWFGTPALYLVAYYNNKFSHIKSK